MRLNDRVMTVLTGVLLAAGAGAAALLLGDHGQRPEVVVAALTEPAAETPRRTANVLTDIEPGKLPGETAAAAEVLDAAPGKLRPDEDPIVLASLEPAAARAPAREVAPDALQLPLAALHPIGEIRDIVLTRAAPDTPPRPPRLAAVLPSTGEGLQSLSLPLQQITDCGLDVRVARLTGARLRLRIDAPCHPGVAVTIEHAGLRFKERLDAKGRLTLKVPVFEEYARFDIRLPDGTATTVGAFVADLSRVERVGIGFAGGDDTFLHAMEPGATFDGAGHVWRLRPRSRSEAIAEGGGYMTVLGDPDLPDPELAQIFTFPRAGAGGAAPVSITVETLRSACGKPFALALARLAHGGAALTRTITTTRAGCDDAASFVLKDALKPITLAQG